MARGGYRPGAGRPKLTEEEKAERARLKSAGLWPPKKAAKKAPAKKKAAAKPAPPVLPEVPEDVAADAQAESLSPLDYMLKVMRDRAADPTRRDRMAIAAAPFMHPRREPVGQGKREKAAQDAGDAATKSRFRPSAPPRLVASNG